MVETNLNIINGLDGHLRSKQTAFSKWGKAGYLEQMSNFLLWTTQDRGIQARGLTRG
jgi:hypothetical protein